MNYKIINIIITFILLFIGFLALVTGLTSFIFYNKITNNKFYSNLYKQNKIYEQQYIELMEKFQVDKQVYNIPSELVDNMIDIEELESVTQQYLEMVFLQDNEELDLAFIENRFRENMESYEDIQLSEESIQIYCQAIKKSVHDSITQISLDSNLFISNNEQTINIKLLIKTAKTVLYVSIVVILQVIIILRIFNIMNQDFIRNLAMITFLSGSFLGIYMLTLHNNKVYEEINTFTQTVNAFVSIGLSDIMSTLIKIGEFMSVVSFIVIVLSFDYSKIVNPFAGHRDKVRK